MARKKATAAIAQYIDPDVVVKPRKAALVAAELQKIAKRQGVLTAENVLSAATPEDHPLHGWFPWDDAEAAHKHRLNVARALIIQAKIIYERKEKRLSEAGCIRVRKYLNRGSGQGYSERAAAIGDEEIRQNLVRSKLAAIRSALRELSDVQQLDSFRAKVTTEVAAAAKSMSVKI